MPSAASSSDTAPSTLSSAAATFCAYSEPATVSSNSTTSATPAFGSIAAASRRIAAMEARGGPTVRMKKASPELAAVPLPVRQINVGSGRLRQAVIFAVLHQTGHRRPRAVHLDPAPHWVAASEVALREGLIDDRHRRAVAVVPFGEVAPFEHRNPQRVEIARRDRGARHAHFLVRTGNVSFHLYVRPRAGTEFQRHGISEAHASDARESADAVAQTQAELRPLIAGSEQKVSRWYFANSTLRASKPGWMARAF